MGEFKKLFEAYGGDYQATMARFLDNEAMYLKFLPKLFQDDNLQKLGDALDAGNLSDAFSAAHTLKGLTGNLGLTPLYDSIRAIVEPLRQNKAAETNEAYDAKANKSDKAADYSTMYRNIKAEYQRVVELWQRYKGEE